ncbi:MAG: DUF1292 domain-containing protein [Clostridia bacterium]|nr:DUF1292 domain-containing protein [Clostridia bacterium]
MDEQLNLPEELDNTVILTGPDGKEVVFEFLDLVVYGDNEYVVLLPADDGGKGEVVLFRIEGEGDEECYVSLSSEEEAQAVFEAFKAQAKDDFDFAE